MEILITHSLPSTRGASLTLRLLPDITNVTRPELEISQHHVQPDGHAGIAAVESRLTLPHLF